MNMNNKENYLIKKGERMSRAKPSKDCEKDCRELQHALYKDDVADKNAWKDICNMLGVPTNADQIYFNAKDITYG